MSSNEWRPVKRVLDTAENRSIKTKSCRMMMMMMMNSQQTIDTGQCNKHTMTFHVTSSFNPNSVVTGSTRRLTEMRNKGLPWGVNAAGRTADNSCIPSCAECQNKGGNPTFHPPSQPSWLVTGNFTVICGCKVAKGRVLTLHYPVQYYAAYKFWHWLFQK